MRQDVLGEPRARVPLQPDFAVILRLALVAPLKTFLDRGPNRDGGTEPRNPRFLSYRLRALAGPRLRLMECQNLDPIRVGEIIGGANRLDRIPLIAEISAHNPLAAVLPFSITEMQVELERPEIRLAGRPQFFAGSAAVQAAVTNGFGHGENTPRLRTCPRFIQYTGAYTRGQGRTCKGGVLFFNRLGGQTRTATDGCPGLSRRKQAFDSPWERQRFQEFKCLSRQIRRLVPNSYPINVPERPRTLASDPVAKTFVRHPPHQRREGAMRANPLPSKEVPSRDRPRRSARRPIWRSGARAPARGHPSKNPFPSRAPQGERRK